MASTTNYPSEGDRQDEFLRLFSSHSRRIYQFILTLVMRQSDAEEIFQDTCMILWKKFGSYDPQGSFYGWACRIAHYEILRLRRNNQRLHFFSEEALSALANKALVHADDFDSRQQALEECLELLSPQDRTLIEQRYHQHRTPKEIANESARSVYSVYRGLARIHTALMRCVRTRLAHE